MTTGRIRYALLIAYLALLLVGELSIESNIFHSPANSTSNRQRSCIGRFEEAADSGSTELTLCNIGNYAYAAYVKIGTPGHGVWLEIDTGSADTWIMSSECESASCMLRKRFDTEKMSTSLKKLNESFNLTFGKRVQVQGRLISDRICFAQDTCLNDRVIGAVTRSSQNGMYSDGVLGLGLDSLSRFYANEKKQPSILTALARSMSSSQSRRVFGLKLNRLIFNDQDDENGGKLTLGYVNTKRRSSAVFRLPLVVDNGGYWMVGLRSLEFVYSCDKGAPTPCKNERRPPAIAEEISARAILDTGSTYILSSSQNLNSQLNWWRQRGLVIAVREHTLINCRNLSLLPDVRFSFCSTRNCSGPLHTLTLTPEQYTLPFDPLDACWRRVCLQFAAGVPFTVLGSSFLSNFRSSFHLEEQFVELAPEQPDKPSPTIQQMDSLRNYSRNRILREPRTEAASDDDPVTLVAIVFVIAAVLLPFG